MALPDETDPAELSIPGVTMYRCEGCEAINEARGGMLYECDDCGNVFLDDGGGSHCPDCN